jgi:hypothetical protein
MLGMVEFLKSIRDWWVANVEISFGGDEGGDGGDD